MFNALNYAILKTQLQQIASMGGQDLVDAAVAARDAAQGYKDDAANSAAQLAAGTASPAGTYADLAALASDDPDHSKIYITLNDGKWCYHNGSMWVAGGVYQNSATTLQEYNVSYLHPASGIGGTPYYTLAGALAVLPAAFVYHVHRGAKITFFTASKIPETYQFVGNGNYDGRHVNNWIPVKHPREYPLFFDLSPDGSGYWNADGTTTDNVNFVYKTVNVATYAGQRLRCRLGLGSTGGGLLNNCFVKLADGTYSQAYNNHAAKYSAGVDTDSIDVILPATATELKVSYAQAVYLARPPFVCYDPSYNQAIDYRDKFGVFAKATVTTTGTESRGAYFNYPIVAGNKYRITLDQCDSALYRVVAYVTGIDPQVTQAAPVVEFYAPSNAYRYEISIQPQGEVVEKTIIASFERVDMLERAEELETGKQDKPLVRALILGDSFSSSGMIQWGIPMINEFHEGSSFVTLGVIGATIRDGSADRATYPYTSRPSPDGVTNHNTLTCQIEKLKRLMAGTDLDGGESQLYTTAASYPNVIILEGGHNDNLDSPEKEAAYAGQIEKLAENVYYARVANAATPSLGNCYIKTPAADVDRTCFAGAYRHAIDELYAIFPNAQVFITTPISASYRETATVSARYTISEQQRKAAKMLSASIIDWYADGQINSIVNNVTGSGTEADPYITNAAGDDTLDNLHPNARGGKKLGQIAAHAITSKLMAIT